MNSRPSVSRRLLASALAALATAVIVYLVVCLAYYVANSGQTASLAPILTLFLGPAVVLLVLQFVVGAIGGVESRVRVLVFSIIVALFSAYLGFVAYALVLGATFTAASTAAQQQLVGTLVAFMVASVVVPYLTARRTYAWALRLQSGSAPEVHRAALVRAPAATLADGELTHLKRKPVKIAKAAKQWGAYVAALEAEGFVTYEVGADDRYPDSVFIEDTVVILGQLAVIASPGAETRRGEQDAVAETVKDLGLEIRHIRLPGTLDGGDVLKIDKTIYVGRGGRTNAEGIRQFRSIAAESGYAVVAVPVTRALHLKSSVTALPDGTVIGHPSLVDHPELFPRYLEVPEVEGVAVVVLSGSAVLMSSSAPKTAELIADLGYRVVTVDIGEFEKLEGCVTCLSVRIR